MNHDRGHYIALTVLQIACIIFLVVQSTARWDRIQEQRLQIAEMHDHAVENAAAHESTLAELETCLMDTQAMEVALNACTSDLRACGAWEAQRRYAADAEY